MFFNHQSQTIYIVDGLRTPVITPHKAFDQLTATQLAATVIRKLVARNRINKKLISQVIFGNVVSAGLGQNFSRQAAISAGLPDTIPAFSVNNVCGAGLQSVILAGQAIKSREAELVIAGGAESTSNSPLFIRREEAKVKADYKILDSAKFASNSLKEIFALPKRGKERIFASCTRRTHRA